MKRNELTVIGIIFVFLYGLFFAPIFSLPVYAESVDTEGETNTNESDSLNDESKEKVKEDDSNTESDDEQENHKVPKDKNQNGAESSEQEEGIEKAEETKSEQKAESGEGESEGTDEHSGGFIIHTEKVQGEMDLLGALTGLIDIKEGVITGLTITKTLDSGGELEPLVIIIESPGPIPVEGLTASTIPGTLPELGGICGAEKSGWVCLSDVTMLVSEQAVRTISLPDTSIKTCLQSECEAEKGEEVLSEEELNSFMAKISDQEMSLEDLMEGLQEDKHNLNSLITLIERAIGQEKEMDEENYGEQLEEDFTVMIDLLENKEEEGKIELEEQFDQLLSMIEQSEEKLGIFSGKASEFTNIVDDANNLFVELEESIAIKEQALKKFLQAEKDLQEKTSDEIKAYIRLSQMNDEEQMLQDMDDYEKDIQEAKELFDTLQSDIESEKQRLDDLQSKKEAFNDELQKLEETMDDFHLIIEELENTLTNQSQNENPETDTNENTSVNDRSINEVVRDEEETDSTNNDSGDEDFNKGQLKSMITQVLERIRSRLW